MRNRACVEHILILIVDANDTCWWALDERWRCGIIWNFTIFSVFYLLFKQQSQCFRKWKTVLIQQLQVLRRSLRIILIVDFKTETNKVSSLMFSHFLLQYFIPIAIECMLFEKRKKQKVKPKQWNRQHVNHLNDIKYYCYSNYKCVFSLEPHSKNTLMITN